jgi:hypothetical protein
MKRYLCWFALGVVVAAPAAAAACWPMWGGRFAYAPPAYGPPVYSTPLYAQPPICIAPPIYAAPPQRSVLPPPRIETIPRSDAPSAVPTPAPAPGLGRSVPEPMPPLAKPTAAPAIEQVRPTAGSDAPPAKPDSPAIAPKPAETPQDPDLTYPKVEIPKNLRSDPKLPPLELPKEADMKAVPKVPAVGAPTESSLPAVPTAAPPPEALIPPPSVPLVPDPGKRTPLPSLTLPPEVPVAPEKKDDSISRSSPLTSGMRSAAMTVSVFPARGVEAPAPGYRTVGFYNHTARDVSLTIEGRAVKLPARTYLQAQLAPHFTWSHSDRASTREVVPEGAGGLEVVFRD